MGFLIYYYTTLNPKQLTVNAVLETRLTDYEGDVETIRHPKGGLKQIYSEFNEKEQGGLILDRLDVEKVLSNPNTCASLRTLFAWCLKALGGSTYR